MARTIWQGNDTDIELTVTDRYSNLDPSAQFSCTLLDQNGDPVSGAQNLVSSWDATLQTQIVTILGTASADLPVGGGYVLQAPAIGSLTGVIVLAIPCLVAIRQG